MTAEESRLALGGQETVADNAFVVVVIVAGCKQDKLIIF